MAQWQNSMQMQPKDTENSNYEENNLLKRDFHSLKKPDDSADLFSFFKG